MTSIELTRNFEYYFTKQKSFNFNCSTSKPNLKNNANWIIIYHLKPNKKIKILFLIIQNFKKIIYRKFILTVYVTIPGQVKKTKNKKTKTKNFKWLFKWSIFIKFSIGCIKELLQSEYVFKEKLNSRHNLFWNQYSRILLYFLHVTMDII